jgi:flagellar hook capping protein FlgD
MERRPHGRHSEVLAPLRASARSRRPAVKVRFAVMTVLAAASVVAGVLFVAAQGPAQPARIAAASSSIPLFGSSVGYVSLAQTTAEFGRMPIVRVYYPGLPASNAWDGGQAGANASAVIVSFKALPADILSGADDATLTHFFDTAPTGHPIYYSYYHEPEDNIADGEFTLADYKAAWARVAALAAATHNPDLHSTLILMSWDLVKASGRDWKSYLPGGGIISTLGWDAYPVGSATNVNPQPTAPADFMGPCIAASNSVGLPYGFAEFGLSTAAGRPAWMTEVGNYLMTSGALFATVFNGVGEYPTLQLTDQASQDVWKGFVAKSTQAQSGPDPAPSSPVTQPTGATPTASNPAPTASLSVSPPSATPPSATPPSATPPSATPASSIPAVAGSWVSGLNLSPARLIGTGSNDTMISFRIGQAADVTVLVLGADGSVVRQIAKPAHTAGLVSVPYYGYTDSHTRLPAGTYKVLIVASNGSGSASAETALTISAP